MKVSVLIPFYREAEYIGDCLRSICCQSHIDWECILVDDCGGDGSLDVVLEFCANDQRFILVSHKQNQGQAAARNSGLRACCGDYIYFMDADDGFADSTSLATLVAKAQLESPDWVQGGYLRSNQTTTLYGDKTLTGSDIKRHFKQLNFTNAAGKLVSRRFILDNDLFFTPGLIYEDLEWNLRAYLCIEKICNVDKACYFHNLRGDSIMRSAFTQKKTESALLIIERFSPMTTEDTNVAGVLIYKALFVLKNLLMADFTANYKRQIYQRLRPTLAILPDYKELPPFTKILAHVRKSYLLSNFLCKIYRWSR